MSDNGFSRACPSGNSMLEYREEGRYCEHCGGSGRVDKTKSELREWFASCESPDNWKLMLEIYREWKNTGIISCSECEGRGEWIVYK
jgi:hypothetical protein